MKGFKIIFGLLVLLSISSSPLLATLTDGGSVVSAPLDGGLLTILGAAGVAYFIARKKKIQN